MQKTRIQNVNMAVEVPVRLLLVTNSFLLIPCFLGAYGGLYNENDPMVLMDNTTVKKTIYDSPQAWIVEFYSSWCGHCHSFAPTWRQLAREAEGWDRYLKVGAIDCAEDKNLDTCISYEIDSFPTIKFYDAHLKNKSSLGVRFKGDKTLKRLRHALVDHIEKQTFDDPPNFKPIGMPAVTNFIEGKTSYQYFAIVFEKSDSYIGKELVLDTSKCKKLQVRRALDVQEELNKKYEIKEYPSLVVLFANKTHKDLSNDNRTRNSFLKELNEIVPVRREKPVVINKTESKIVNEVEDLSGVNGTYEVFMRDLQSAVAYSLRREIPRIKEVKGDELQALRDWVNLILQCLPSERTFAKYMGLLDKWLNEDARDDGINAKQWLNYTDKHQTFDSYLPSKIEWRGCLGSKPQFRGYPCSLWVLFHTMTVHCGAKGAETGLTGLDVLLRIKGYIQYFFGCLYCREHFLEMAANVNKEVVTHNDAILWLWRRHNQVNARLAEDLSTDPKFPKLQFPPEELCSDCRKVNRPENTIVTNPGYGVPETRWNKRVVLEFMKEHYGPDNIRVKDQPSPQDIENEGSDAVRASVYLYRFGLGITPIDTSLCVLIYFTIIGSIIALYLYFVRRTRKKLFKHMV